MEENNLAVHISALRRVLGTVRNGRSMIQTVPRRGYMLLADAFDPVPAPPEIAAARLGEATVAPANGFVGRGEERVALAAQLAEHALVTITASGGMGKTRLARQVAQDVAASFHDGVYVADLSCLEDPAHAAQHVAALFPLGSANRPILEQLTGFLRGKRLLLLLDNCEHLLLPIAELASAVLAECPGVDMLATSREALGVAGERLFPLPPLPVSDPTQPIGAAERCITTRSVFSWSAQQRPCPTSHSMGPPCHMWWPSARNWTASRSRSRWRSPGCAC